MEGGGGRAESVNEWCESHSTDIIWWVCFNCFSRCQGPHSLPLSPNSPLYSSPSVHTPGCHPSSYRASLGSLRALAAAHLSRGGAACMLRDRLLLQHECRPKPHKRRLSTALALPAFRREAAGGLSPRAVEATARLHVGRNIAHSALPSADHPCRMLLLLLEEREPRGELPPFPPLTILHHKSHAWVFTSTVFTLLPTTKEPLTLGRKYGLYAFQSTLTVGCI